MPHGVIYPNPHYTTAQQQLDTVTCILIKTFSPTFSPTFSIAWLNSYCIVLAAAVERSMLLIADMYLNSIHLHSCL